LKNKAFALSVDLLDYGHDGLVSFNEDACRRMSVIAADSKQ
jgi:hypothetical protein